MIVFYTGDVADFFVYFTSAVKIYIYLMTVSVVNTTVFLLYGDCNC